MEFLWVACSVRGETPVGLARQSETLQAKSRSGCSARAPRKANPWSGKQHPHSKGLINILYTNFYFKIQEFFYSLAPIKIDRCFFLKLKIEEECKIS